MNLSKDQSVDTTLLPPTAAVALRPDAAPETTLSPSLAPSTKEQNGTLPPSNGQPSVARAADMMTAPAATPDVMARAQMSIAMQRTVGNARMGDLLRTIPEPKAPPPTPAAVKAEPPTQPPIQPASIATPPKAAPAQTAVTQTPTAPPAQTLASPAPLQTQTLEAAQTPAPSQTTIASVAATPMSAPQQPSAGQNPSLTTVAQNATAEAPTASAGAEAATPSKPAPAAKAGASKPATGRAGKAEGGKEGAAAAEGAGAVEADAQGKEKGGARDIKLKMPEPPADVTPAARQRIRKVQTAAGSAAASHAALPPATAAVTQARSAVTEPQQEANAHAGEDLVTALGQRPKPSPEIEQTCQQIRDVIREMRPPDKDSLVKADPEAMGQEAGNKVKGKVEGKVEGVGQSYDALDQTPTGTPQQGAPLEAPSASAPVPAMNASQAAPDAVPAENVSLDADVEASKAQMDDAGMNTEPAKLVQTGPVAEAREAQGELEKTAAEDPAKVIAAQQAAISKSSADMAALQQDALAALAASRSKTVSGTTGQQKQMVGSEEQKRAQVGAQTQAIFTSAQTRVNGLLQTLPQKALKKWDDRLVVIKREFKESLKVVEDWIKERHSGVLGATIVSFGDWVSGLPPWVTIEYNKAEKKFGDSVCELAREISAEVNGIIMTCEALIADARTQIATLFASLPASLQAWAAGEQAKLGAQLDALHSHALETRDNFNRELVGRATQTVQEVREQIHALREKAKGALTKLGEALERFAEDPAKFILEGLLDLLGIAPAAFYAVVAKIQKVTKDIADDPEKFANNLMDAIGKGFTQFFDNIAGHLLHGFVSWLTGGLADAGVTLPKDLSLKSIITFILELMGITWPRIRKLLAKHIGEENVALLEKAYSIVANLVALGPEGVFEMIKEKLNPQEILDQIIKAAVDYMITAVIKAVSARILLLFNPVGAILQAIEAIYKVLKWIFTNAARIFSLIETIVNGIADIIAGNIGGMANAVEKALAGLIPPVIAFLADYLGFGDLPEKVKETIIGFQNWVEGILDQVIGWLVEKGKALLKAVGLGGKEEDKKGKPDGAGVGEKVPFTADGEGHSVWIDVVGANAVLMVASDTPMTIEQRLKTWAVKASKLPTTAAAGGESPQAKATRLIGEARPLTSATDKTAEDLIKASQNSAKDEKAPPPKPGEQAELSKEEHELADKLKQLFEIFGEEWSPLSERFKKEFDKMHPLASEYSLKKLEEADEPTQKSQTWKPIRTWLLANGLIFTQPMTTTTKFAKEETEPKAVSAAELAIKSVAKQNGLDLEDIPQKAVNVVDNSRSEINAGSDPYSTAKEVMQEFGFHQGISPVLPLKHAYFDEDKNIASGALAKEVGLGEVQLHHLITEQMVDALIRTQPQIPARQLRNNKLYQKKASPGGHIGYEKWHRDYDDFMVNFITGFAPGTLTVDILIREVHNYYQTDHGENVTKRIPNVKLI